MFDCESESIVTSNAAMLDEEVEPCLHCAASRVVIAIGRKVTRSESQHKEKLFISQMQDNFSCICVTICFV